MMTTWKQVSHWKNSIIVYKHAINVADKKYPHSSVIHNNLGIALFVDQKKTEAISHFKMAIKLNPNYIKAHYNLGVILLQKGEIKEAIHHFTKTLRLRPGFVRARDHLELALLRLEKIR
jgi:tetratricopeptide (TPR) repeat protein